MCDSVVALLGDGLLTDLPGGIDEYLAQRAGRSQRDGRSARPGARDVRSARSAAAEQRAARKELTRLERRLERVGSRQDELQHAMAEAAAGPQRFRVLDAELSAVLAEKDNLETRWLEMSLREP